MRRICKYCGTEYDGDPGSSCCPDCAAAQRATTLRPRTCRQCGVTFDGGPRAWYCPDCRAERQREAYRRYRRSGPARPIGSEDLCEICGRPYVVESGRQRYCKDCAEAAVRAVDNAQSRAWNKANTTPEARRAERKAAAATIQCVVCGKGFVPTSSAKTCSPACAAELARRRIAGWESARKEERNAYRRSLRQARKDAQTPPPPPPPPRPPRICKICGTEFIPDNGHQLRCPECRAHNRRRSAPLSEPVPCSSCGVLFVRTYNSQRMCPDCQAARPENNAGGSCPPQPKEVFCAGCGASFVRTKPYQRLCPDCQAAKAASLEPRSTICTACGASFVRETHSQRLCPDCRAARKRPEPWTTEIYCMDCGSKFIRTASNQRRCPACRAAKKKD